MVKKKSKIFPGDLVVWINEHNTGNILEAGVVIELHYNEFASCHGAKIAWESGIFWSPLKQLVKVEKGEHEISKKR